MSNTNIIIEIFHILPLDPVLDWSVFYNFGMSQFGPATFQVLDSWLRLVPTYWTTQVQTSHDILFIPQLVRVTGSFSIPPKDTGAPLTQDRIPTRMQVRQA